MNCEFVDRGRIDTVAVRALARRLARGRVIAMFPESGIRTMETSVLNGGRLKPGCVHLAQITGAPIIPCAIVGTKQWSKFTSWLPLKRTVFGLNFGEPIYVAADVDSQSQRSAASDQLAAAYLALYEELKEAMGRQMHLCFLPPPVLRGRVGEGAVTPNSRKDTHTALPQSTGGGDEEAPPAS
jgi:1-acyl-sn-glycerol-3-phosphate acyltransferase